MNIFIRADASVEIGTGHVMRCLTLAEQLREQGAKVAFISRSHKGNLHQWIMVEKKFSVYELPLDSEWLNNRMKESTLYERWLGTSLEKDAYETQKILTEQAVNADWLIVDHYALDERWEKQLRPYVRRMMVIDDLANRKHDCDVLLDQNLYEDMNRRYNNQVPAHCITLLGPQFALLRKEFIAARKTLRNRKGQIKRILVFFGGSDPTNETTKTLHAIKLLNRSDIIVDVVVGYSNPNKDQIKNYCAFIPNVNFYCQVTNMAELMTKADLAIGAGGSATWERCCVGLPSIVISVADNQVPICKYGAEKGLFTYLGVSKDVTACDIQKCITIFLNDTCFLLNMSRRILRTTDGQGISKVCKVIL